MSRWVIGIFTWALLLLLAGKAQAKEVQVTWKAIPKATGYELRIQHKGTVVSTEKLNSNSWKSDLPFGLYGYQIRGVDKIGRPGKWTALSPLAVMPESPKLQAPRDGDEIVLYDHAKHPKLSWTPVEDVSDYEVEVFAGQKVVSTTEVHGTEMDLVPDWSAKYSWQVRPVMEPGSIPDFKGRKWKGKPGERFAFKLDYRDLKPPETVSPVGPFMRPRGDQVEFRWKDVEGAEAYEVTFAPAEVAGQEIRKPAAESFRKIVTKETRVSADKIPDGTWVWSVRALASVDPGGQTAAVKGAESDADFTLETATIHPEGQGYVAFSMLFAPYTYQVVSSQLQGSSQASATGMDYRLGGEYWPSNSLGVQAAVSERYIIANQQNISAFDWDLWAKKQFTVGPAGGQWFIQPKAGILSHQYPHLLVGNAKTGFQVSDKVRATGFGAGVDVRHAFSERLSLGAKLEYFVPIGISADNGGGVLYPQDSYRNLSVGLQAIYWLGGNWGVGAGAYLENRSIGYKPVGAGGVSTDPERILMDGSYFYGSVIYSWGR
jgi:hypothetical protein